MPYQIQNQRLGVSVMFSDEVLSRLQKRDKENLYRFAEMEKDASAVRFTNFSMNDSSSDDDDLLDTRIEEILSEIRQEPDENDDSLTNFALAGVILQSLKQSVQTSADKTVPQANEVSYQVLLPAKDGRYRSVKGLNLLTGWSLERFDSFLRDTVIEFGKQMVMDGAHHEADPIANAIKAVIIRLVKETSIDLSLEMSKIIDAIKDCSVGNKPFVKKEMVLEKSGLNEAKFAEALDYLIKIGTVCTKAGNDDLLKLNE